MEQILLDNLCYESLLRNNGSKEKIRRGFRDKYFSEKFGCYVEMDASNDMTYETLFQKLISRGSNVKKTPYGEGCHWKVSGETFYIYPHDGLLYIENLRPTTGFVKEVSHCNPDSMIGYFMRMEEIHREADEVIDRMVSLVEYRLAHADEEKAFDEELDKIRTKCRKRVQQEKDCESLKQEFLALNRKKRELLRIPGKVEEEEIRWQETWNDMVEEFRRYWQEFQLTKARRDSANEQKKEDAKYREMVEKLFPSRKIKPLYRSHYKVYCRPLQNGQVLVFMDTPGNPKRIVQHGVKFAELLDKVVGILNKHVVICTSIRKKKKMTENENDAFLKEICLQLTDAKMKFEVECLSRSYRFSVVYKDCGLSFSIASKEYPEGTEELVKAVSAFLKFVSKSKMDFDIRVL